METTTQLFASGKESVGNGISDTVVEQSGTLAPAQLTTTARTAPTTPATGSDQAEVQDPVGTEVPENVVETIATTTTTTTTTTPTETSTNSVTKLVSIVDADSTSSQATIPSVAESDTPTAATTTTTTAEATTAATVTTTFAASEDSISGEIGSAGPEIQEVDTPRTRIEESPTTAPATTPAAPTTTNSATTTSEATPTTEAATTTTESGKQRNEDEDQETESALEAILKPCADSYFVCNETNLESRCRAEFETCSVRLLSDRNRTEGVIPDELTDDIEEEGPKDETLPSSLLQCILDNHDCIDNKKPSNCMATYNACSLKALEDFRTRRLRLLNGSADESPVPASRASDETEVEELNKYLSGNFTSCVQSYTACTAEATIALEMNDCVKRFHSCSLQLLKKANIEDKQVEGIHVEPTEPVSGGDDNKKLSSSLFSCIQDYVMCLMRKDNWCMRSYNNCTLQVLDADARAKQKDSLEESYGLQGASNKTADGLLGREGEIPLEDESSSPPSVEAGETSPSAEESAVEATSAQSGDIGAGPTTESSGLGNLL